jgi:hypothetical protein
VRGNGHNADATSGGDIKTQCIAWRIGCMPNKVSWVKTRCCHSTINNAKGICKGRLSGKGMFEFCGRHWMLPSNID